MDALEGRGMIFRHYIAKKGAVDPWILTSGYMLAQQDMKPHNILLSHDGAVKLGDVVCLIYLALTTLAADPLIYISMRT